MVDLEFIIFKECILLCVSIAHIHLVLIPVEHNSSSNNSVTLQNVSYLVNCCARQELIQHLYVEWWIPNREGSSKLRLPRGFPSLPINCSKRTSTKATTASFHSLSNSLFIIIIPLGAICSVSYWQFR
jgi:hypothetical protein